MTLPAVPPAPHPHAAPPWSHPLPVRPVASPPYARADLRIGDAERWAVCESLSAHFAEGRLTPDELDARLEAATGAVTLGDVRRLTADLPDLAGPPLTSPPRHPRPAATAPPGPSPVDVLIGIGVVGAMGLIMVMLFGIGMVQPGLFLASAVGGTLALLVGAGGMHLWYRTMRRRS